MGFFAEVGPLDVFVSKHLIPADMSFDPQSNPAACVRRVERSSCKQTRTRGVPISLTCPPSLNRSSPPPLPQVRLTDIGGATPEDNEGLRGASARRCFLETLWAGGTAPHLRSRRQVRLRVIGTRMDAAEIFAIGSIKEDFLGVIGAG